MQLNSPNLIILHIMDYNVQEVATNTLAQKTMGIRICANREAEWNKIMLALRTVDDGIVT